MVIPRAEPTPIVDGGCPQCGHERGAPDPETWVDRLLNRLGVRPVPAACNGWTLDGFTGWGEDCTCRHPFHGS